MSGISLDGWKLHGIHDVGSDGSLVNPFVAGAVAIWAAVLSSLAVLAARRQGRRTVRIVALAFAVVLTTATSVAQLMIGVILYSVTSARFVDVGFWGGPPLWPAPVVAIIAGLITLWFQRSAGASPV